MVGFIILILVVVFIALKAKGKYEKEQAEETVQLTAQKKEQKVKKETEGHKVAGTSFRQGEFEKLKKETNPDYELNKREIIRAGLEDKFIYQYKFTPEKVELIPEPTNEHDPNAIMVVVDGVHIGYIKKGSCTHIHNLINNDRIESIEAKVYGGKYKVVNVFDYGEDEKPEYEFESGSDEYRVKIEILEKKQ